MPRIAVTTGLRFQPQDGTVYRAAVSDRTRSGGARRAGFVALGWLPAPAGGPERMRRAALRARVAVALGPALAPHVVSVSLDSEGLAVVWLRGSGWERQLSTLGEMLRQVVETALGETVSRVEIRSAAIATPVPPARRLPSDASPRERLSDVARQILARHPGGTS